MPTDTKPLTDNEVIALLAGLGKFSEDHCEEWRNEVARDLNHLVEREIYNFETHGLLSDYSRAVLRIVNRVVEFDEISRESKKPEAVWQLNTYSNPFYDQPKCEVMFKDRKTTILKCPKCARGMFDDVVKWRPIP